MLRYAITAGTYQSAGMPARDGPSLLGSPGAPPTGATLLDASSGPQRGRIPNSQNDFPDRIQHIAENRIDFLQLREKHLTAGELSRLSRQILSILQASGSNTRLLINTRADVAAATGAHGVHLPATPGSLQPAQVRLLYRSIGLPPPIISQACHTLAEIRTAYSREPDLILFSPIFGKFVDSTLTLPPAGLEALHNACTLAAPIPVLALGGVTLQNTPACLEAGAQGVAGIRLFDL